MEDKVGYRIAMPSHSSQRHAADETRDSSTWRICCISPSRPILEELTPTLVSCFPGAALSDMRHYPSLQELEREFEKVNPDVCLVDVISDRERALPLIADILKVSPRVNVLALLGGDEPDLILRCLRQGAREFLLRPFGAEQLRAALPKLSKANPETKSSAKVYCVMPAQGAGY